MWVLWDFAGTSRDNNYKLGLSYVIGSDCHVLDGRFIDTTSEEQWVYLDGSGNR